VESLAGVKCGVFHGRGKEINYSNAARGSPDVALLSSRLDRGSRYLGVRASIIYYLVGDLTHRLKAKTVRLKIDSPPPPKKIIKYIL